MRRLEAAEAVLPLPMTKDDDGPVSRYLNRPLSTRITRLLLRTPVTPNQVTVAAFLLSLAAAALMAAFGRAGLAAGGLVAHLSSVLDGCDGELARAKGIESAVGGWLDSVLDRIADACMIFGMTWNSFVESGAPWILLLGFLAMLGSFMVSYTAVRNDTIRRRRIAAGRRVGVRIGRDIRLFILALGAVTGLAVPALAVIAAIMNAETARRIWDTVRDGRD